MKRRFNIFRAGKLHVCEQMCETCIFRPGNQLGLRKGRVADMVRKAVEEDSSIPCHATLYSTPKRNAVCRGFFDKHKTSMLQIAERLGLIVWQKPEPKEPQT